jgi:hypothetical protein
MTVMMRHVRMDQYIIIWRSLMMIVTLAHRLVIVTLAQRLVMLACLRRMVTLV